MSIKIKAALIVSIGLACAAIGLHAPKAHAANAADFRPGHIIDDSTFTNQNAMSVQSIQTFLNSKVSSCQAGYTCLKDYSENGKSAAQIIWEQAQNFSISPQTIIVLLQKEQGLVTDTWPTPTQYTYATGFCVPDGPPPPQCQGTYGFTNQIYYAARMFRKIVNNDPSQYTPYLLGNNPVAYHPNGACGAPTVFIENRSTIALYTYTPYQPNPAAMANLYGTGDGCSAYGNRNFWRLFTDWFGPTTGEGYVLATSYNDNGDPRQWVVYKGIRRHVPSAEVLRAWGLDQIPLAQWTGTYLGSISEASPLDRLMRPTGSLDVYFVDNRNAYKVVSPEMMGAWSLNSATIADVSVDLARLPLNQGNLTYALRKYNNLAVYMMDGGTLRQYGAPNVLAAWEGDNPKIIDLSQDYSGHLSSVGSMVSTAKAKNNTSPDQYNVVAGQKLYLSSGVAPLYPGTPTTVSDQTMNRLIRSADAVQFVRGSNAATVYLVDTTKHPVGSPELVRAWGVGANPSVNIVTQGNLDLLTTGANIDTFEGDVGGQLYIMDGRRIAVPTSLDSGYRTTGNVYSASAALIALSPNGGNATNFIKGFNAGAVYLMDAGTTRHIRTPYDLASLSNNEATTSVSDYVLGQFTKGGFVGSYLTSGGTNYAFSTGTKFTVDTTTATNWNLSNPDAVASSTVGRFPGSSALSKKARVGSAYYLVRNGKSHLTYNTDLAGVWGLTTNPNDVSSSFMQHVTQDVPLSIFVRSSDTNDQRIFIADNAGGQLYHLTTVGQVYNFGYQNGGQMMQLSPSEITAGNPVIANNIIRKTSGGESVLDSGAKRAFTNGTVQSNWVTGSNTTTVSDSLWAFIPAGASVGATIKGSAPNVYTMESGQKRWIQSNTTYQTYAPYYNSSDYLLGLLPTGANLP